MEHLTLDQFLLDLPWSDNVRHVLRTRACRDDLLALTASRQPDGSKLSAQAWTKWPPAWPSDTVAIWAKRPLPNTEAAKSRTMQAVALALDEGLTAYAAAKQVGVNHSAVSRALALREANPVCPCCQQIVRRGFTVDRSILKDPALDLASS